MGKQSRLPFNENPPMQAYNFLSLIGGILLTDDKYWPFYLSNYVNYTSSDQMLLTVTNDIWFDHADVFDFVSMTNNYFSPELN